MSAFASEFFFLTCEKTRVTLKNCAYSALPLKEIQVPILTPASSIGPPCRFSHLIIVFQPYAHGHSAQKFQSLLKTWIPDHQNANLILLHGCLPFAPLK